jgi:predicted porin
VAETSNGNARLSEASVVLFGSAGRLEVGKRMGLPDVLSGYAPNSFTFTMAEFGPPTGRTLDPGGGLQTQFLHAAVRSRLEPLASRGVTASLFNDESTKILYVLPKRNGWLGGVSFSTDAEDPRFDRLTQLGVVHESYWHQNVWRWGGTYAHARANQTSDGAGLRDLDSVSFGTSVTLDDSLDIGLSGSYDGRSGTSRVISGNGASPAWGVTASLNYNTGPWTVGGYFQRARAPAAGDQAGNDRVSAFELGVSYRFTTRVRLYGAWFLYDLANDRRRSDPIAGSGGVFTLGLRATL